MRAKRKGLVLSIILMFVLLLLFPLLYPTVSFPHWSLSWLLRLVIACPQMIADKQISCDTKSFLCYYVHSCQYFLMLKPEVLQHLPDLVEDILWICGCQCHPVVWCGVMGNQAENGGHQQTNQTEPQGQRRCWTEAGLSDSGVRQKDPV